MKGSFNKLFALENLFDFNYVLVDIALNLMTAVYFIFLLYTFVASTYTT